MNLLETTLAQAKAWVAAQTLGTDNEAERRGAMHTLRALGAASLPSLHATVRRTGAPRAQFSAAVVLHWLGDPNGMSVLIDGLKWQLPAAPALAHDLEAAFVLIGSPDAPDALIRVWMQLLTTRDNQRVRKSICRVWATLKDPRPLEVLAQTGMEHAELFEETVPRFGETALPTLALLAADPDAAKRHLAVRTLRHVASPQTASLLFPLLCDSDAAVRALIPASLEALARQRMVSDAAIYAGILDALEAGYSTSHAVTLLLRYTPFPYDALLRLVQRWEGNQVETGDTLEAVLTALPAFGRMRLTSMGARSDLQHHLCAVLARQPEPPLVVGIARVLATRGPETATTDAQARRVLFSLLPHTDAEVRQECANALVALGDSVGKQFQQRLEASWPQPNLRDKFQSLLRGAAEATHVANHAMQWFTRFSRETVERWNSATTLTLNSQTLQTDVDSRLPGLLQQLLDNALVALEQIASSEQTEYRRDLSVACMRALMSLDVHYSAARAAHNSLARALLFSPPAMRAVSADAIGRKAHVATDCGEAIRLEAGQALLAMYGPDSFPLFVQSLYTPELSVRVTGILFLGELGDARALPLLQSVVADENPILSPPAQAAMARIRQHNPETMTLLRASDRADSRPETLLRPSDGTSASTPPELLLRPVEPSATPQTTPS